MKKKALIVTNNPLVRDTVAGDSVQFCPTLEELLLQVRDLIHRNYKLRTHPLTGNIQAVYHPYRSVVLTEGTHLDVESLTLWETTMERYRRAERRRYPDEALDDFQHVDYELIRSYAGPEFR